MSAYDPVLLQVTGMDVKLDFIFRTVGQESVWNITEQGSKLLTLKFLCTLQITDTGLNLDYLGKNSLLPGRI